MVTTSGLFPLSILSFNKPKKTRLQEILEDVNKYEEVVLKSVMDFHTYSPYQKQELYSSLAQFNISILKQLVAYKQEEN